MKHIDLDALPWFSKQQIAEHQLDRAIRLLLDEGDAISAVTLAGAAEEILGELVRLAGAKHAVGSFVGECLEAGKRIGEKWKYKEFADMLNLTRNALKHYDDGADVSVTEDDACEMIDRAIENLDKLEVTTGDQVNRYTNWRHSSC
ncbi:hypothetical protein [Polaromonas sp.]|uniref:hypothetical protein n=1 Tax=Polaromonas sp. TaxID=1869339 RepID=UPI002487478C|nr:hypothetical protein [Polaromonas sp.]MDI1341287.1 hypothetical protein [Polaromonas sp.]